MSVLVLPAMEAAAQTGPSSLRLLPRTLLDAVTLPIHTLQARSPADNTTLGAGLSTVTLSSDRECVFCLRSRLVHGIWMLTFLSGCRSYYALIKAGPFNFRVALDTGSADLWLFSTSCETQTCKQSPRYPLEFESPTFISVAGNATNFTASYADGTGEPHEIMECAPF